MQYRDNRKGEAISALGYGCMRFTRKGSGFDEEKAEQELMEAYRLGVNYYDTAYIYPGSEELIGKIFERNGIRDKINIATKLPQYLVKDRASLDKYFNEQMKRLRTAWADYYLMHHMSDIGQWEKLKSAGIEDWIREKKESGQIRQIGFSFHGTTERFLEILDAYDWDFCQIQYNYADETSQAGRRGLETAFAKGIPVIIMEPLRGGKLVDMLPEEARTLLKDNNCLPSDLAFRWLWDQPGVTCILSGMNSLEMVRENCACADRSPAGSFTDTERSLVNAILDLFREKTKVGCTECRYCMPCPRGVDIPGIFRCYNRMYTENKFFGRKEYFQSVALSVKPAEASQCIECGKCEQHCPQSLPIRRLLKEANRHIRPFPYGPGIDLMRRFMLRKAERKQ